MSERGELEVALEQLDELLGEGAVDVSDALEIATCAGIAARLGAEAAALAAVDAWRAGPGGPLLDELLDTVDAEPLVEAIDDLIGREVDERVLEDAVFDFDDLVVALIWIGRTQPVRAACRQVAETIRMAPDSFAELADYGRQHARLPAVAEQMGLYDYWFALADADAGDEG